MISLNPNSKNQAFQSEEELEIMLQEAIDKLRAQVERKVPDEGEFRAISTPLLNLNIRLRLTNIKISVIAVPVKSIGEQYRYLEIDAYNLPEPYLVNRVIRRGTTQEILEELRNRELVKKIIEILPRLEEDLSFY